MALIVDTNSYISETDADTYFLDRLNSTEWDTSTDKDKALIQATQLIDFRKYQGEKTSSTQSLKFPRSGLYDDGVEVDSASVPQKVKDATCELAIYLLQEDYTAPNDLEEYSRVKIASIEVETKGASNSLGKTLPPFVINLLSFATASSGKLYRG